MNKSATFLVIAILSTAAMAQTAPQQQSFVNKDGEYLFVEARNTADSNQAFPAVVAAIEKAGYTRLVGNTPQYAKSDTWCRVDVYMERQIIGECSTAQMGHGLSVRDHLAWTKQDFKADYSGVPTMIAKIRDEQRRASAAIGIKS